MRYLVVVLLLAAAAYVYAAQNPPEPKLQIGRYSLVTSGDNGIAWKIDTATGTVFACFTMQSSGVGGQVIRQAGCDQLTR